MQVKRQPSDRFGYSDYHAENHMAQVPLRELYAKPAGLRDLLMQALNEVV